MMILIGRDSLLLASSCSALGLSSLSVHESRGRGCVVFTGNLFRPSLLRCGAVSDSAAPPAAGRRGVNLTPFTFAPHGRCSQAAANNILAYNLSRASSRCC